MLSGEGLAASHGGAPAHIPEPPQAGALALQRRVRVLQVQRKVDGPQPHQRPHQARAVCRLHQHRRLRVEPSVIQRRAGEGTGEGGSEAGEQERARAGARAGEGTGEGAKGREGERVSE